MTDENNMIDPKALIKTLSVEELSDAAESYFQLIKEDNLLVHLGKPFSDINGVSDTLQNMGHMLSELQLGKSMTVLDFAAGTCWFSRYLTQLRCQAICCDVSDTALGMGRELFEQFPPIGNRNGIYEPRFLKFDGHRIDLPDESVDRIICHDGLHHVPNQGEVIAELARVLRTGGIAAFSEPGRFHSQSESSQFDMRNYTVLENDIILPEIYEIAEQHGFTDIRIKPICNTQISLQDYQQLTSTKRKVAPEKEVTRHIRHLLDHRLVFFLYKGDFLPDSRLPADLSHTLSTPQRKLSVTAGQAVTIPLHLANTGKGKWIDNNVDNIGVVFIASHLYDNTGELVPGGVRQGGLSRDRITRAVLPGESLEQAIEVVLQEPGEYRLSIDLHAEQICWFKALGADPLELDVVVRPAGSSE